MPLLRLRQWSRPSHGAETKTESTALAPTPANPVATSLEPPIDYAIYWPDAWATRRCWVEWWKNIDDKSRQTFDQLVAGFKARDAVVTARLATRSRVPRSNLSAEQTGDRRPPNWKIWATPATCRRQKTIVQRLGDELERCHLELKTLETELACPKQNALPA